MNGPFVALGAMNGAFIALPAATGRLLGGGQVQRCGPVPCDCDDEERLAYERVHRHAGEPTSEPSPGFVAALNRSGAGLPDDFRAAGCSPTSWPQPSGRPVKCHEGGP